MVARSDGAGGTRWAAVNSCLLPAGSLAGQEVVTAEGLGTPEALHPVQYEMAVRGGSQCGYCTPGFVCSMAAEYYRADPDGFDLDGDLGQPVPLHGVPPHPRRRPRPRAPPRPTTRWRPG